MFSCYVHGWASKEKPCPMHPDGNIYSPQVSDVSPKAKESVQVASTPERKPMPGPVEFCKMCNGTGTVQKAFTPDRYMECPTCQGSGKESSFCCQGAARGYGHSDDCSHKGETK